MYGYQAGGAYFQLSPSSPYKTVKSGQTQNGKDHPSVVQSPKNIEVLEDRIRSRVANPVPVKIVPSQPQDSGHFVGYVGDSINRSKDFPSGRYVIKRKLGAGTYGKVLECTDKKYNLPVAVKIVRRDPPIYKEAAKKEIKVLRYLGGTHGLVKLLRDFVHDGHICMSLEMYGDNIQHYMRRNKKPFKIHEIKDIGLQIVHATCYMHNKGVIHTDIKAENVLLAHGPDGAVTIKVVDLGSAIFVNDWHPPVIGTLEYRAPEIILQADWSYPVDMYATGCVLAELCIGDFLFPAYNEAEYLSVISTVTENSFPPDLIRRGKASPKYRLRPDSTRPPKNLSAGSRVKKVLSELIYDDQLLSLLEDMLAFDPNLRISATDAKKHPFFFDSNFDSKKTDDSGCLEVVTKSHVDEEEICTFDDHSEIPNIPLGVGCYEETVEGNEDNHEPSVTRLRIELSQGSNDSNEMYSPGQVSSQTPLSLCSTKAASESAGSTNTVDASDFSSALSSEEEERICKPNVSQRIKASLDQSTIVVSSKPPASQASDSKSKPKSKSIIDIVREKACHADSPRTSAAESPRSSEYTQRHSITETVQSNLVRHNEPLKTTAKRPGSESENAQSQGSYSKEGKSELSPTQGQADMSQSTSIYGTCKEWEVALSDRISQLQSRLAKLRSYNK